MVCSQVEKYCTVTHTHTHAHTHTHTHSQTEFGAVSVGVKGFNKETDQLTSFSWASKLLQTVTAATKLNDACCLEEKL